MKKKFIIVAIAISVVGMVGCGNKEEIESKINGESKGEAEESVENVSGESKNNNSNTQTAESSDVQDTNVEEEKPTTEKEEKSKINLNEMSDKEILKFYNDTNKKMQDFYGKYITKGNILSGGGLDGYVKVEMLAPYDTKEKRSQYIDEFYTKKLAENHKTFTNVSGRDYALVYYDMPQMYLDEMEVKVLEKNVLSDNSMRVKLINQINGASMGGTEYAFNLHEIVLKVEDNKIKIDSIKSDSEITYVDLFSKLFDDMERMKVEDVEDVIDEIMGLFDIAPNNKYFDGKWLDQVINKLQNLQTDETLEYKGFAAFMSSCFDEKYGF